jgi:alkyl hydroperoxide reductase subunit AhpC
MKSAMKRLVLLAGVGVAALLAAPSLWAVRVGEPAPDFTATDSTGKVQKLSDYKGKFVVLEWHNRECPYTHKHYVSGNMQKLQKEWTTKGVAWFTVISSAPGQQGYMTAAEENAYVEKMKAVPTGVLLDPTGDLGHLYEAKTTPQIFIINPQGTLIYDGAIDSKPTTEVEDIASAKNYANLALEEAMAGQQVKIPVTRPYGCSVKYAH